jgi:hypothetical protein
LDFDPSAGRRLIAAAPPNLSGLCAVVARAEVLLAMIRIETITGRSCRAEVFYAVSGKSARIEIWSLDKGRRLDTRRASPARAEKRARELLDFWSCGSGHEYRHQNKATAQEVTHT